MGPIYVEERGRGPSTIFIHGLASGRSHFDRVARQLAPVRRCLLVDLPGHGQAGASDGGSPADYAAGVADLVREEAPVHVIGASFGALVAGELWRLAPTCVASLVLVDPPLDYAELMRWAHDVAGAGGPRSALLSLYTERDPDRLVEIMRGHPLTDDLDEPLLRENALLNLAADQKAVRSTLRALSDHELRWQRPERGDARVTVVRATRGHVCPAAKAAELASALRGEVVSVASGHTVALSAPDQLAQVLREATATEPVSTASRYGSPA